MPDRAELIQATCPKCSRSWPIPCEQSVCIELFHECMVCRFSANGTGTKEEVEMVTSRAAIAALEAKPEPKQEKT